MSYRSLIGKPALPFTLPNYTGESFTFTPGSKGLPTVLFFYPESGSYGCTVEACRFRDAVAEKDTFKPGSVEIIGISPDPVENQKKFVEKQKLTYPVLSDADGVASKAYGVGTGFFGLAKVARVTFVIDKEGIVRDALEATMNIYSHSTFVASWLDKLQKEKGTEATATTSADPPRPVPT